MAKITDLVKTYRMLSDPNAPDWNVKFVGAITVAVLVVAAGAGAIFWATHGDAPSAPGSTVASTQEPPAEECPTPAEGEPVPTVAPECLDEAPVLP